MGEAVSACPFANSSDSTNTNAKIRPNPAQAVVNTILK